MMNKGKDKPSGFISSSDCETNSRILFTLRLHSTHGTTKHFPVCMFRLKIFPRTSPREQTSNQLIHVSVGPDTSCHFPSSDGSGKWAGPGISCTQRTITFHCPPTPSAFAHITARWPPPRILSIHYPSPSWEAQLRCQGAKS